MVEVYKPANQRHIQGRGRKSPPPTPEWKQKCKKRCQISKKFSGHHAFSIIGLNVSIFKEKNTRFVACGAHKFLATLSLSLNLSSQENFEYVLNKWRIYHRSGEMKAGADLRNERWPKPEWYMEVSKILSKIWRLHLIASDNKFPTKIHSREPGFGSEHEKEKVG